MAEGGRGTRAARLALVLLAIALPAGCTRTPPPIQAIDSTAISVVENDLKRQVGIYIAAARDRTTVPVAHSDGVGTVLVDTPIDALPIPPGDPDKRIFACGTGRVAFDITSVTAELKTSFDRTLGISASATIPVDVVTLTPSYSATGTASNLQTLDYQLFPLAPADQANLTGYSPTQADIDHAPIAKVLLGLRSAVVGSATRYDYSKVVPSLRPPQPCFTDYDPRKVLDATADKYTIGLSFTSDQKGGLTVQITVLSLGANGEWKSLTGNTLVVAFGQPGLADLAKAEGEKAKACAKKGNSEACKIAIGLVERATGQGLGLTAGRRTKPLYLPDQGGK